MNQFPFHACALSVFLCPSSPFGVPDVASMFNVWAHFQSTCFPPAPVPSVAMYMLCNSRCREGIEEALRMEPRKGKLRRETGSGCC